MHTVSEGALGGAERWLIQIKASAVVNGQRVEIVPKPQFAGQSLWLEEPAPGHFTIDWAT